MFANTSELIEQVPALVKAFILSLLSQVFNFVLPEWLSHILLSLVSMILTIGPIIGIFAGLFAVLVLMERKGLGRFQNRYGPNRVGPFGVLQPVADGIKMLIKEDLIPDAADKVVHFIAPVVIIIPPLLALSVIPYGKYVIPIEVDAALLFFFAAGVSGELAVFMAGWASRNKYSVLGAMRAIAQMISYEIPLILAAVPVIMMVGSLSTTQIVAAQNGYTDGWFPQWYIFTPWGLVGFIMFMIGALAESNRSPFDMPEAESELIAGHLTEYSGFKYALFFMAEYFGMIAISGMGITLFVGGWSSPFPYLTWIPSYVWFGTKLMIVLSCFIWIRATVPRLRVDQLMNLAWKVMLPLSLVNILVAALWSLTSRTLDTTFCSGMNHWAFEIFRWIFCAALLLGCYVWFSHLMKKGHPTSARTYRYSES